MPTNSRLSKFYPGYLSNHRAKHEETPNFGPSVVPPHSYWTPDEKERFFKALPRYSRLQPELIQQCVGTSKTVWEVCNYIDFLEVELASEFEDNSYYETIPAAHQMSDKWVAEEERQSSGMVLYESIQLGRFYKEKIADCPDGKTDTSTNNDSDKWRARQTLRSLNLPGLVVLDNMVRETEE